MRLRWELNQLWPYKDMRASVGKYEYNAETPKQGSKRLTSITKTIHFARLGILDINAPYPTKIVPNWLVCSCEILRLSVRASVLHIGSLRTIGGGGEKN